MPNKVGLNERMVYFLPFIYCSDEYRDQKQLGGGKSLFPVIFSTHSPSLREVMAETQSKIMENVADQFAFHGLLNWLF